MERWVGSGTRAGFPVMAGALPGIGHAPILHADAAGAVLRAKAALGPVFWVHLGFGNWYLFCVGKGSFDLLRHPQLRVSGSRESLEYLLGKSLLTQDGADHRRVRGAMTATFSPRGLAEGGSGARIREVVSGRAARWARKDHIAVHNEMKEMALDVVFRITGVGEQDLPMWRRQYGRLLLGLVPIPLEFPGTPRHMALRAAKWLNAEIRAMVDEARSGRGQGMARALADAQDEQGNRLSTEELVDNIRLLFLAGHETTATTTAYAILEMTKRHDVWDKMVEEACAGPGVPTSAAEAKAFPLCEGVFRESVRLYGPAWFIERRAAEPITHEGQAIPAGTNVGVCPPVWARDPSLFDRPDEFDPERWLTRPPPTPIEISQFGGGAHFCLGYHLAWLEVIAFLVALGREMGPSRRRPHLRRNVPLNPRYFPILHPPSGAAVTFR